MFQGDKEAGDRFLKEIEDAEHDEVTLPPKEYEGQTLMRGEKR